MRASSLLAKPSLHALHRLRWRRLWEAAAAQRGVLLLETAIAAMLFALKGYPKAVVEQFDFLLNAAQQATILQEDHNYWIDQRCMHKVRLVLLEFGRRFAKAGIVEGADDVFYLTPQELRDAATALKGDRRQLVAQRKAEMKRFAAVQPPPLGTMPSGPPLPPIP